MNINIERSDETVVVFLNGRLDANTSDTVRNDVLAQLEGVKKLVLDMTDCLYVSSSGLRALLTIYKSAKLKGSSMQLRNLCDEVRDVINMTGFSSMFNE